MSTPTPLALYVHIPFCETKCPYCDFNTYAAIEPLMPAYVDALTHEIAAWGAWLGRPALTSVFFGGGTPSYLSAAYLARLTEAIRAAFGWPPGPSGPIGTVESTAEANPGDCTADQLRAMRAAGFNRLSIGVQSFDDAELRLLGRRHSADDARAAVRGARAAGFANLSIDLMLGLPDQTLDAWGRSIDEASALDVDHVSVYALTLEGGTPMEADVARGALPEPDADLAADMYLLAQERLAAAGFAQYEISNWAKPGMTSRHNLAYWEGRPYLGVGPGAHSHLLDGAWGNALGPHGVRFANLRPPRTYIERVSAWEPSGTVSAGALRSAGAVETADALSEATAAGETMMMGLRLNEGVSDAAFRERFGAGIAERFPRPVAECVELGLLEWAGERLRLTEEGRLLGNEAFGRFVAAAAAGTVGA